MEEENVDKSEKGQNSSLEKETNATNEIFLDFTSHHKHLIEPSVFEDTMRLNDKAISLALGQIHHNQQRGRMARVIIDPLRKCY